MITHVYQERSRPTRQYKRQRVIAPLGDARLPADEKALIAKAVEFQLKGEPELGSLMLSDDGKAWVDRILNIATRSKGGFSKVTESVVDGVLIDQIETENVVELGPELVALKAWEEATRVSINDGSLLRIRKPSLPDTEQASVYEKLGIDWRSMCSSIKSKLK